MTAIEYHELEKEILWGFSFFEDLIDIFHSVLEEQDKSRKAELDKRREGYRPDIVESAWAHGNTTKRAIDQLARQYPERANELKKQLGLRLSLLTYQLQSTGAELLPSLTWNGVFLSVMAHFESSLFRLCYNLAETPSEIKKFEGAWYTSDYKEYLTGIIDFNFGSSSEWSAMQTHRKIRNLIAHKGGFGVHLDDNYEAVTGFVRRSPTKLYFNDIDQLELMETYVTEVNQQAGELMVQLSDSIASVLNV